MGEFSVTVSKTDRPKGKAKRKLGASIRTERQMPVQHLTVCAVVKGRR